MYTYVHYCFSWTAGQDQSTNGGNGNNTIAWPYLKYWQLMFQTKVSTKMVKGKRGIALVGKTREGIYVIRRGFNSAFQDNKQARFAAVWEACWKLKESTIKEQNDPVDKQRIWLI